MRGRGGRRCGDRAAFPDLSCARGSLGFRGPAHCTGPTNPMALRAVQLALEPTRTGKGATSPSPTGTICHRRASRADAGPPITFRPWMPTTSVCPDRVCIAVIRRTADGSSHTLKRSRVHLPSTPVGGLTAPFGSA